MSAVGPVVVAPKRSYRFKCPLGLGITHNRPHLSLSDHFRDVERDSFAGIDTGQTSSFVQTATGRKRWRGIHGLQDPNYAGSQIGRAVGKLDRQRGS